MWRPVEISDELVVVELCTLLWRADGHRPGRCARAHRVRPPPSRPAALASCSTSAAARSAPSLAAAQAPSSRARAASDRSASARRTASRSGRRRQQPPRQPDADPRPVDPGRVLAHVAAVGDRQHRAAGRERAGDRAVAGVGDHERAARASSASRRSTRPAVRSPARARASSSGRRFGGGEHPDRLAARPGQRRAEQPVVGILRGRRARRARAALRRAGARRRRYGGSHISGPTTWTLAARRADTRAGGTCRRCRAPC